LAGTYAGISHIGVIHRCGASYLPKPTLELFNIMIRINLSVVFFLWASILSAQEKSNYQNIRLERIPSGKIFLPKLVDGTGKMKVVLDKINKSILNEFDITSYEETAERPWDEIEMDLEVGNDILLISIRATLDGSVTGFGQPVSESLYFDLTNGDRLKEPAFISPLSYFSTDGYLQFLKDYDILEDYNIAAKEAIECTEGTIPMCHLHQLEFSFHGNNVAVFMDRYECYPRWGYACQFTAGAELKLNDFLNYLNRETKEYFKLVSANKTFEIFRLRQSLIVPNNYALFGKIDGKYPFSMMFNIKDKNANGHYFYNAKKELIKLTGKIENGRLILKESFNEKHTGTFIIEKPEDFNEKIYWESPDGKKRFNVTIDSQYSLYDLRT